MLFVILAMMLGLRALASAGGYVSIYDLPYHPTNTWPSFVLNLFLVQAWNILPTLTWNGASWFVSVEFLLCLLFPIYLFIARGGVLRAVLLIVAGGMALNYLAMTSGHGLDLTFHNGIFRGMAGFAIGVGCRCSIARPWRAAGAICRRDCSHWRRPPPCSCCSTLSIAPAGRTSRTTSGSRLRWRF